MKELLTTETRGKDDVFNDDESILVNNNNSTNSLDATSDASD